MKAEIRVITSTSQGTSKITGKPPEEREKALNGFFLTALRRGQTYRHLGLGLGAFRTVRQYIFV